LQFGERDVRLPHSASIECRRSGRYTGSRSAAEQAASPHCHQDLGSDVLGTSILGVDRHVDPVDFRDRPGKLARMRDQSLLAGPRVRLARGDTGGHELIGRRETHDEHTVRIGGVDQAPQLLAGLDGGGEEEPVASRPSLNGQQRGEL
jgi:hypothetical protein